MHSSRMHTAHTLPYRGSLAGVSLTETPLDNLTPGQRPQPCTETPTPLDRDLLDTDPQAETPGQRTPWTRDSPWTETPQTETPLDREPLGQRTSWTETSLVM